MIAPVNGKCRLAELTAAIMRAIRVQNVSHLAQCQNIRLRPRADFPASNGAAGCLTASWTTSGVTSARWPWYHRAVATCCSGVGRSLMTIPLPRRHGLGDLVGAVPLSPEEDHHGFPAVILSLLQIG